MKREIRKSFTYISNENLNNIRKGKTREQNRIEQNRTEEKKRKYEIMMMRERRKQNQNPMELSIFLQITRQVD